MFCRTPGLRLCSYSLLSGVQQLVFAAPAVTRPDTRVGPESADCIDLLQVGHMHRVYILQPPSEDLRTVKVTVCEERFCCGETEFIVCVCVCKCVLMVVSIYSDIIKIKLQTMCKSVYLLFDVGMKCENTLMRVLSHTPAL